MIGQPLFSILLYFQPFKRLHPTLNLSIPLCCLPISFTVCLSFYLLVQCPVESSLQSLILYFTLLFSSACTNRRRGGTQLSVSSKVGGLEKGHPLNFEGVCHGVAPSFSWSSSRSPAGVLGVVCPEGGLVYRHTCDVSEPLDLLLFDVL